MFIHLYYYPNKKHKTNKKTKKGGIIYPATAEKAYGWHDKQQLRHMHEGVNPIKNAIRKKQDIYTIAMQLFTGSDMSQ